jgi:hypothetical protein
MQLPGVSKKTMKQRNTCINCFVGVVEQLRSVFNFPKENIQILYDPKCLHLTAFNRNRLIYLNLGHFEQEHYADGTTSNLASTLLSWYFILAHELTVSAPQIVWSEFRRALTISSSITQYLPTTPTSSLSFRECASYLR